MYENFNAFLFRYIVTVHVVAFTSLFFNTLILGIKPKKEASIRTKILYSFLYSVPIVQIVVSVARVNNSFEDFSMANPIASLTNFFYSPMLTVLLLWFILRHFTLSDKFTSSTLKTIDYSLDWLALLFYMFFGAFTSFAYTELASSYDQSGNIHWISFLGFVLVCTFAKFIVNTKVTFINNLLFWYLGTWLFFLHLI